MLAPAFNANKVQGLRLPKIVVSFDLHPQRNLIDEKIYVAFYAQWHL